jgi:hypothetical protein
MEILVVLLLPAFIAGGLFYLIELLGSAVINAAGDYLHGR